MYFVYENWTNTFCRVHRADCSFCNSGRGLFGGGRTPSGQWHQGFQSRDEALAAAARLAGAHANASVWNVGPCHFCCSVP